LGVGDIAGPESVDEFADLGDLMLAEYQPPKSGADVAKVLGVNRPKHESLHVGGVRHAETLNRVGANVQASDPGSSLVGAARYYSIGCLDVMQQRFDTVCATQLFLLKHERNIALLPIDTVSKHVPISTLPSAHHLQHS
jgi:hypothetical protein